MLVEIIMGGVKRELRILLEGADCELICVVDNTFKYYCIICVVGDALSMQGDLQGS